MFFVKKNKCFSTQTLISIDSVSPREAVFFLEKQCHSVKNQGFFKFTHLLAIGVDAKTVLAEGVRTVAELEVLFLTSNF